MKYSKFVKKYNNMNVSDIKIELFRYFDTLNEKKLINFYDIFLSKKINTDVDFWELLSDWEKDDINAGLTDLKNGRFKEIDKVMSKYK